ncbi:hypothetical protein [uncultured Cohaesibacter sp.]|uniref:hypothetical protein n=1 Tax=uncultured Cohaesibacter sp. TaxID=1002546 RepID=UPI002AA5FF6D|nr:hypothetical protein [uncultured Cohaesibacter sp.]
MQSEDSIQDTNVVRRDAAARRKGMPADPNDFSNPLNQLRIFRKKSRLWRANFSDAEFCLFDFLADRSVQ